MRVLPAAVDDDRLDLAVHLDRVEVRAEQDACGSERPRIAGEQVAARVGLDGEAHALELARDVRGDLRLVPERARDAAERGERRR